MANKLLKTLKIGSTSMDVWEMITVTASSVSALPFTLTNASITADMAAIKMELSNPSAQIGKWTVTPADGSLVISGSISGTTDIKLYLQHGKTA